MEDPSPTPGRRIYLKAIAAKIAGVETGAIRRRKAYGATRPKRGMQCPSGFARTSAVVARERR